jgi:HK97 family phage major capsid protein
MPELLTDEDKQIIGELRRNLRDEMDGVVAPIKKQVAALLQRTSRLPGTVEHASLDGAAVVTAGKQFIDSDALRALLAAPGQRGKALANVGPLFGQKQITNVTAVPPPLRLSGIVPQQRRELRLRDLIPTRVIADQVGSVDYLRQKPRTTAAAPQVNQGDIKSELTLATDLLTANFVTIACWTACSRQIMMDLLGLEQFINTELSYATLLEEEREILVGNSANGELTGLLPGATPFDPTLSQTGDTNLDQLARSETQLLRSDVIPSAFVVNPLDMAGIETLKSSIGTYLSGEPGDADFGDRTLWGLQVVVSNSMPSGKFLCGDFATGCGLLDRQAALIELSTEHADFFVRNLLALRCEERVSLAIYKPWAFVSGTFSGSIAASTPTPGNKK